MNTTTRLPSLEALKAQAKRLRASLHEEGNFISHSEALEFIARQFGYRDWNTIHAAVGNRPSEILALGSTVSGHYLGQAFRGEILGVTKLAGGSQYRVTLHLDEPVDVVKFDSFSALRRRINGTVGRDGCSTSRTSDGQPHLVLDVAGQA
tara:strand:- start:3128 stop:3577 length:450 start_codon:yes stop_codon:yes gene_type:complete